jgi:hypothetical protein
MEISPTFSDELNALRPDLFMPDPNPNDEIASDRGRPETKQGVFLEELAPGEIIEVETKHHSYLVENYGKGQILISGHPEYCPHPVLVDVYGSTWGGAMLKPGFIGRGMHLEFRHPSYGVIHTSRIREIRQAQKGALSRV